MIRTTATVAAALAVITAMPVAAQDDLDALLGPEEATTQAAEAPAADAIQPSAEAPATGEAAPAATQPEELPTIPVATKPEPVPEPPAQKKTSRLVEEIVVTAQKREEAIQDVPISIQAFSMERLDVLGLQTVQDLQRATPGFTVTTAAAFNIVFLRGVGSDAYLPAVDSSVPFYLDGVPLLSGQGSADTLGRIERIEVLKGPQGTLFGRNATGGTISIVTPEPGETFEGDIKAELGSWNTRNAVGYVNVPVTDAIAFNLSAYGNERENIIENAGSGHMVPVYGRGGRAKLRIGFTDDLSLTLNGSYNAFSGNGGLAFQNVRPAPALAGGGLILPADPQLDRNIDIDGDFGTQGSTTIFGGTVNWALPWFDAKLIVSDQDLDITRVDGPFDGTRRPVADAHAGTQYGSHQVNQQRTAELQFLSNPDMPYSEHFNFVFGAFWLKSTAGFDPIVFMVAPDLLNEVLPSYNESLPSLGLFGNALNTVLGLANLPPIFSGEGIKLANYGLLDSQSLSFYTQGTLHATETVDITAGLRLQEEERTLEDSHTSYQQEDGTEVRLPLPQGAQEPLKPRQLSARLAFQWRPFGDDDQIYASWARAHKSPTYNTVNLLGNLFGTMVALKPERVDTYELGIKTKLFDGALSLNTAAFWTIQKDPLSSNVSIPSGGVANFTNAGEAQIKGIDGDFMLLPMMESNPGLAIFGGFSYLDAKYTDFKNGRGYDDATGLGFGNGGASMPARDLSGNRIPRVPEWAGTLGANQRFELESGNAVEVGVDASYASKIYFLPQNSELSVRDPVTLVNAHVSYFHTPWNLELTAFCNNITDEIYADSAFVTDFGTALMANEDPRIFGLRAKYSFGSGD